MNIPDITQGELSVSISPGGSAVGQGEPLILSGNLKFMGLPLPAIVVARIAPVGVEFSPELLLGQVKGVGFASPVGYSVTVATDDLEYGTYKLQVIALGLPPAPPIPLAVSSEITMGIEPVRISVEVVSFASVSPQHKSPWVGEAAPSSLTCTVGWKYMGNRSVSLDVRARIYDAIDVLKWEALSSVPVIANDQLAKTTLVTVLGLLMVEGATYKGIAEVLYGTTVVGAALGSEILGWIAPSYTATLTSMSWGL